VLQCVVLSSYHRQTSATPNRAVLQCACCSVSSVLQCVVLSPCRSHVLVTTTFVEFVRCSMCVAVCCRVCVAVCVAECVRVTSSFESACCSACVAERCVVQYVCCSV